MSKKILFISDTHGDNTVYKEIIDCEKADLVVHAGDYHDFHFSSPHTIVELDARVDHSILGNHGLGIKKFSKSSSLPSNEELMEEYIGDHKIIKFDYLTILLTHIFDFSPRSMNGNIGNVEAFRTLWNEKWNKIIEENEVNLIVQGHTHVSEIKKYNGIDCINPGSVTMPKYPNETGTYIIGTLDNNHISFEVKNVKHK